MSSVRKRTAIAVFFTVLAGCSSEVGNQAIDKVCRAGTCISLTRFGEEIKQRLDGKSAGYAFVISGPGLPQGGHGGQARTNTDLPSKAFEETTRINIGSVSKTITAIAVIRLLDARGLTIREPIRSWLPSDWARGQNVDEITFEELLTHTSGIRLPASFLNSARDSSFDGLRELIANGVALADKTKKYENANFALLRVLSAYLAGFSDDDPAQRDARTAATYGIYVRQTIFEPLGIQDAQCKSGSSAPALSYPVNPGSVPGVDVGDLTSLCGASGWNLSARELWYIVWKLRYSETLLSDMQRQRMDDRSLGWEKFGANGEARGHNGLLPFKDGAAINTAIAFFPATGTIAALLINSPPDAMWGVLLPAYDAAHVSP